MQQLYLVIDLKKKSQKITDANKKGHIFKFCDKQWKKPRSTLIAV